jgi:hypothetical protein
VPLSRPPAPLRSSTGLSEREHLRLVTRGFPDAHAHAQLPGSPADYGLPFHPARGPCFPFALDAGARGRPLTQLHPLRSLTPPESPFTPPQVAPRRRPLLSWRSALLEHVPLDLGASTRPDLTVRAPPAPPGADRDLEDLRERAASTPVAGRDPHRRKRRLDPVGRSQPCVGWAPPPPRRRTDSLDLVPTTAAVIPGLQSFGVSRT